MEPRPVSPMVTVRARRMRTCSVTNPGSPRDSRPTRILPVTKRATSPRKRLHHAIAISSGLSLNEGENWMHSLARLFSQQMGGGTNEQESVAFRHMLSPRNEVLWLPNGLLIPPEITRAYFKWRLTQLDRQEVLIAIGNQPTMQCRIHDFPDPFDGAPTGESTRLASSSTNAAASHVSLFRKEVTNGCPRRNPLPPENAPDCEYAPGSRSVQENALSLPRRVAGTEQGIRRRANARCNGRPQDVLLNRKDKGDNIEHNLTVTRLLDAFGMPFRVGPEVDQHLLPDAEIGQLCIEVDLGTMDGNRMEAKCVRYVDAERPVIAVTTSENRVETLREHGSLLQGWLLCTTLAEALKKGQATNWKNKVYALEEVLKKYGSFHEGSTT